MQPSQLEQLKADIVSSSVLSPAERQEWLGLLEFMNDKQLSDLQQIVHQKVVIKESAPVVDASPVSTILPPVPLPNARPSPPPLQGAPLNAFLERAQKQNQPVIAQVPTVLKPSIPSQANKPSSDGPFKRRLKTMLNEKELPAAQKQQSIPASVPPTKVQPKPASISIPVESTPKSVKPQMPSELLNNQPKVSQIPTPENTSPVQASASINGNFLDLPFAAAYAPELNGPEDLPKITVRTLRDLGAAELKARVQACIQRADYFETVFLLEKSPLYRMYVSIGKIMLESHLTFEVIAQACQERNLEYLTRQEFEDIADLMSGIRSV